LPERLSALAGSLDGPPDLGRNHDKYLTYAERDDAVTAPLRCQYQSGQARPLQTARANLPNPAVEVFGHGVDSL
jgi:hypothetical protein